MSTINLAGAVSVTILAIAIAALVALVEDSAFEAAVEAAFEAAFEILSRDPRVSGLVVVAFCALISTIKHGIIRPDNAGIAMVNANRVEDGGASQTLPAQQQIMLTTWKKKKKRKKLT